MRETIHIYSKVANIAMFVALPLVLLLFGAGFKLLAYLWALMMSYGCLILIVGTSRDPVDVKAPPSYRPPVSLIIPARNESSVLKKTIESVFAMDYRDPGSAQPNFEVIVVNHGSNDGTPQVLKELATKYPLKILDLAMRAGAGKAVALNAAFDLCSGEVICILDADARMDSAFLLRAIRSFADPRNAAVQCRKALYSSRANPLVSWQKFEYDFIKCALQRGRALLGGFTHLSGNGTLIRRDILEEAGGWSEAVRTEDLELTLRLLARGVRIRYVDDPVVFEQATLSLHSLIRQRVRWAEGVVQLAPVSVLGLFLSKRSPVYQRVDVVLAMIGPLFVPISFLMALGAKIFAGTPAVHFGLQGPSLITLVSILATLPVSALALSRFAGLERSEPFLLPLRALLSGWYSLHTLVVVPLALVKHILPVRFFGDAWLKTEHAEQ